MVGTIFKGWVSHKGWGPVCIRRVWALPFQGFMCLVPRGPFSVVVLVEQSPFFEVTPQLLPCFPEKIRVEFLTDPQANAKLKESKETTAASWRGPFSVPGSAKWWADKRCPGARQRPSFGRICCVSTETKRKKTILRVPTNHAGKKRPSKTKNTNFPTVSGTPLTHVSVQNELDPYKGRSW